jgi:hypothetical protein
MAMSAAAQSASRKAPAPNPIVCQSKPSSAVDGVDETTGCGSEKTPTPRAPLLSSGRVDAPRHSDSSTPSP